MKDAPRFKDRTYVLVDLAGSRVVLEQSDLPGKALTILMVLARPKYAENGAPNGDISTHTQIVGGEFGRLLKGLIADGYVEQKGPRQPYKITTSGRAALGPMEAAA